MGKGVSMGKKKKGSENKHLEILLIDLYEVVKNGGEDRGKAMSLVEWYLANQYWTPKQLQFVKSLLRKHKRRAETPKRTKKPLKYSLYAISDGEAVKLGVSTSVKKRLKTLQTSHHGKLVILWTFYIGRDRTSAYKAEHKLHRYCKKYAIRGEWFDPECMVLVEQFRVKQNAELQQEQTEHDLRMLEESPI